MTDIYKLFNDLIELPSNCTEFIWYEDDGVVTWNEENDINALLDDNGETYSCDVYGSPTERKDYVFYTVFDGCGGRGQLIFKISNNRIDPGKYYAE